MTQTATTAPSDIMSARNLLTALFTSLCRDGRRWCLTRTLKSDNPAEIQGVLRGSATFTPIGHFLNDGQSHNKHVDLLYREEGEMPSHIGMGMAGLRWSKKYIWRMDESGKISVWFVKVGPRTDTRDEDEVDYLFHEFEVVEPSSNTFGDAGSGGIIVSAPPPPPSPPPVSKSPHATTSTVVITARGSHLCINDMYRTAYAFRCIPGTGEVLSWSSRHIVKGPKKDQDIINLYELAV